MVSPGAPLNAMCGGTVSGASALAGASSSIAQGVAVEVGEQGGLMSSRRPGHRPLLSAPETDYVHSAAWFWPVAGVAAALLALLCLRWLLTQLRTERVGTLQLEPDRTHGGTRIGGGVLTDAVEAEVSGYQGVHRVRARLTNDPAEPALYLTINTQRGTDLHRLRTRIQDKAIPHLREALELDRLPTQLTLRLDTAHPATRTR